VDTQYGFDFNVTDDALFYGKKKSMGETKGVFCEIKGELETPFVPPETPIKERKSLNSNRQTLSSFFFLSFT